VNAEKQLKPSLRVFVVNQSVKFSTGAYRYFRIKHLTVARKPFKNGTRFRFELPTSVAPGWIGANGGRASVNPAEDRKLRDASPETNRAHATRCGATGKKNRDEQIERRGFSPKS
jgi:hypothetical protein